MSLVLTTSGSIEYEINSVTYLPTHNVFVGKSNAVKETIEFQYPLSSDDKFNTKFSQFKIFLFHRDAFATNDIFRISAIGQKLGWFFPIQALLSSQHDHADNEHFFPYSFNAYKLLIKNSTGLPYKQVNINDNPTLETIYGENTYVLILYKPYLNLLYKSTTRKFQIDNYLPFFYLHGYTYLNQSNFLTLSDLKATTAPYLNNFNSAHVQIEPLSNSLNTDTAYINSLIQGLIKLEKNPLVKFMLLYSVIELLIAKIFEAEFKRSVEGFLTSTNFYESKEKLAIIANEKSRINKLFSSACPGINHSLLDDVKNSSNDFLAYVFSDASDLRTPSEALYKVRSTIFHNFRLVPAGYEQTLTDVVNSLEKAVLNISILIDLDAS
jgi:hypothetical protein